MNSAYGLEGQRQAEADASLDADYERQNLDDLDPDACTDPRGHDYQAVGDEMGDPQVIGGWVDASYMECTNCGHSREITDADLRAMRDEAESDAATDRMLNGSLHL